MPDGHIMSDCHLLLSSDRHAGPEPGRHWDYMNREFLAKKSDGAFV
jgi:hypothetical protein